LFEERLSDRLFSGSLESKSHVDATCEDNDEDDEDIDEDSTNIFSHLEEAEFTEY
jgi:hypothetical protein